VLIIKEKTGRWGRFFVAPCGSQAFEKRRRGRQDKAKTTEKAEFTSCK